ncbi:putative cytochrome P450 [Helianthus annuus]|nr:putative cytochrome P450 [Helianthus annuus]
MDLSHLQENDTLVISTCTIILVIYCLSFFYKATSSPPEASGAWPIIGHFKVFNGPDLPHVTLASLADRYGHMFMIRLGIRKVLVVSDWEIAKDLFTTHDVNVSDRPQYIATKILGFDGASFSFTPYSPYWRGIRKIISQELLSTSQLEKLKPVRLGELERAIKNMHDIWREKRDGQGKVLVEMKKWFGELNMNTMLKVVAGKRYTGGGVDGEDEEEMKRCREVIRVWFQYLGQYVVADALPFLGWLDLGGHENTMKRIAKELDLMVGKWLEEHRHKRSSSNAIEAEDFMDVMIRVVEDDDVAGYNADTIIKATVEVRPTRIYL